MAKTSTQIARIIRDELVQIGNRHPEAGRDLDYCIGLLDKLRERASDEGFGQAREAAAAGVALTA